MKTLAAGFCALLFASAASLGQAAADCPPRGDATRSKVQKLNESKARTDVPTDDAIDDTVTLEALLEPGDDSLRFENGDAVQISAFVLAVRDGGASSSNCHSSNPSRQETVLELVSDPNIPDPAHGVFAVVTPLGRAAMARQGVDGSTRGLRARYLSRWVLVTGWLLYDFEAASRAVNTAPLLGPDIARATAWEIHPVTAIELDEEFPPEDTVLLRASR